MVEFKTMKYFLKKFLSIYDSPDMAVNVLQALAHLETHDVAIVATTPFLWMWKLRLSEAK